MLVRTVTAEALDGLAADDPAAVRSRRDLRRIHRFMATRTILNRTLRRCLAGAPRQRPLRILELGAGDGTLLLGVAGELASQWPVATVCLLDRQPVVASATVAAYARLGWSAQALGADVLEWSVDAGPQAASRGGWDLILANLFLHHFDAAALARLLGAVAGRCDRFIAVEPRRARLALAASHLVGALGANAVTRADAVLSVHAGFRGNELAALWGAGGAGWRMREYPAGLFSHVFEAVRPEEAAR